MAKKSRMSLFVERFVSFNQTRYADNPEALARFTGLTEDELTFEAQTLGALGARTVTVKSVSRNFIGVNQSWLAADINSVNAFDMTSPDLLEDLDAVKAMTVPGLYGYLDEDANTKIALVLENGTATELQQQAAKDAFIAALRYEVTADEVTTTADSIKIEAPCIFNSITFVVGAEEIFTVPATDYGQLTFPEDAGGGA